MDRSATGLLYSEMPCLQEVDIFMQPLIGFRSPFHSPCPTLGFFFQLVSMPVTLRPNKCANLFLLHSKRLGHIGVFSGEQIQAQRRLVVTGRMYLGERSILAVLATEFETGYPSEKVLRVFRSVGR